LTSSPVHFSSATLLSLPFSFLPPFFPLSFLPPFHKCLLRI
jgi:hypothetical protein